MFFKDLTKAASYYQYWMLVGFINTVSKYRESALGTFWVSGSIAIFIILLGNLYALVFNHSTADFIPYLAVGYIFWHLISGSIAQSCKIYKSNRNYILQSRMPLPVYNFKSVLEILIILLHNFIIIIAVFLWYWHLPDFNHILQFFGGLILIIVNMIWVSVALGIIGAAYRDLVEFTNVFLRIAFLATPIIWKTGEDSNREIVERIMYFNPFYHFIEVVRAPLLGETVQYVNWCFMVAITVFGFAFTAWLYRRYFNRVAVWV